MTQLIDYEAFSEWQTLEHVQNEQLGSLAGVTGSAISKRISAGKPMRIEWLMRWKDFFGWSYQELNHFFMNGPIPQHDKAEKTYTKTQVLQKLTEVLFDD